MLMGVSKPPVHCWTVASIIHVHCNSLEPILTEENKWARFEMAMHFRDPVDLTEYQDMHDWIHLDEKWFFLSQEREIYILLPEEKNQSIASNSKSHITKVMFLCTVARRQYNPCAKSWWDGKLHI